MVEPEEFLQFLKARRSIREFKEDQILEEHLEMILEAGRWTPSAINLQPWEFVVIKESEVLGKISRMAFYGKFIKNAPVAIAIVGKIRTSSKWYIIDTSLVSMNMMLMAWSLGIGTCWIGAMNREKVKKVLGLEEYDYVLTVLPFGYIKGDIPEPTPRKPLNKIIRRI